jgi:hypothetical protein
MDAYPATLPIADSPAAVINWSDSTSSMTPSWRS